MHFNKTSNFAMSSKGVLSSVSNNTTFGRPTFSRTSGNGGTGAYGEVSDGQMIFYGLASEMGRTTVLNISQDFISAAKKYNAAKSLYWMAGGVSGGMVFNIDDKIITLVNYFQGESVLTCGCLNPEWFYDLTKGAKKIQLIHYETGNTTNGSCRIGFATGTKGLSSEVQGLIELKQTYFNANFYKESILVESVSTFSALTPCPGNNVFGYFLVFQ